MKKIILLIFVIFTFSMSFASNNYNKDGIKMFEKRLEEKVRYEYQKLELQPHIEIYPNEKEAYIKVNLPRKNSKNLENVEKFSKSIVNLIKEEAEKYDFFIKNIDIKVREYSKFKKGKILYLERFNF